MTDINKSYLPTEISTTNINQIPGDSVPKKGMSRVTIIIIISEISVVVIAGVVLLCVFLTKDDDDKTINNVSIDDSYSYNIGDINNKEGQAIEVGYLGLLAESGTTKHIIKDYKFFKEFFTENSSYKIDSEGNKIYATEPILKMYNGDFFKSSN